MKFNSLITKSIFLAAVAIGFFSANAIADDANTVVNNAVADVNNSDDLGNTYNRHYGFYASGNLGVALSGNVMKSGKKNSGFTGLAASIFVGKHFTSKLALEAGFAHYNLDFVGASIFDIVAKGILPLGQRYMLFGKLGGAITETEACFLGCETHNQLTPAFGVGFGVGINKDWAGTLEYNGVYMSSPNTDNIVGGLTIGATRYFDA